jgi:DNA invertase Pin-like site-specific DNA recombinase
VGYARVSTDGQTLDAQQAALAQAGCERVFAEKISGAVTERKALARAIAALAEGDTLVVCKLDRARTQHQGLAQYPRCNRQGWRYVQVIG